MRKILLVFITIAMAVSGYAQKTVDIGLWGGSSTYFGDIREASPLHVPDLNIGAYLRYNFNARVAFRAQFLTGSFSADGHVGDSSFDFDKNAQDVSAMMEINFLRYVMGEKKVGFTPYIMAGVGMMYFPYSLDPAAMRRINENYPVTAEVDESVLEAAIPFGFGFKFSIGPRLGIGAEYQMRKLFSDKFDNVDDPLSFIRDNGRGEAERISYTTFLHNNDWPGYLGIHVTYKLYLNPADCPAYERKNWK